MRDSARHYLQTFLSVVQDLSRCLPRRPRPLGLGTLYAGATNICNAKCVFCAYKTSTSPRGHLPFEIFKKAADDYVELGGRSISFTPTVGDPLVDPGLFEKIKYALGLKSIERVNFYTNGILLATNYNYRSLVDLRVPEIHISIPQPERSAYQEIYGVDAYPQLLEGLKLFLEYNRSQGEPCSIQIDFRLSIPASQIVKTADFVAFIQPYLSRKVTMTYMPNYDNWGGMIQEKHLPGAMRMRRIPAVKTVMCRRMEDVAILWDGSVRLCACRLQKTEFDELVVGHLEFQSLKEILQSPKAEAARDSFRRRELLPVCRDCSLYETTWF